MRSCRVATSAGTAGERDRFARLPAGGANTAMATLDPAYKLTKDRSVCLHWCKNHDFFTLHGQGQLNPRLQEEASKEEALGP